MACKLLLLALLLSCASHTAHSAGVRDHLTFDADTQVEPPLPLKINKVSFTITSATTTSILICVEETLTGSGEAVGDVKLTYGPENCPLTEKKGILEDDKCGRFEIDEAISEEIITYLLVIEKYPSTRENVTLSGIASFAFTAKASLITCGLRKLTRSTWTTETSSNSPCLNDDSSSSCVCYAEGDFSGAENCFTTTDGVNVGDITVCRIEKLDPITSETTFSVDYLGYDLSDGSVPAQLALSHDSSPSLMNIELIVWQDGEYLRMDSCDASPCTWESFTPSNSKFEICAAWDSPTKYGYDTIQDVNLYAYDLEGPDIIEFGFVNSEGTSNYYTASLHTYTAGEFVPTDDSVNLDCTDVTAGHYCYGFLYYTTPKLLGDGSYLSLQYTASSDFDNPNNMIASKVLPASGTASGGRV